MRSLKSFAAIVLAAFAALATATYAPAQTTPAAVQVANVAQVRAGAFGTYIFLQGTAYPGDGGGGFFARTFQTSCTDDGYNALKQSDGQCLVRLTTTGGAFVPVSPQAFGAKMDGATNDCAALTNMAAALTAAGGGQIGISGTLAVAGGSCPSVIMPSNLRIDCVPGSGFLQTGTVGLDAQLRWNNPLNIAINDCTFAGNNKTGGAGIGWLFFNSNASTETGKIYLKNLTLRDMVAASWVLFNNTGTGNMAGIDIIGTKIRATAAAAFGTEDAIAFTQGPGATGLLAQISVRDTDCQGANFLIACVSLYDGARFAVVDGGSFIQATQFGVQIVDNQGNASIPYDVTVRNITCNSIPVYCVDGKNAGNVDILDNHCFGQTSAAGWNACFTLQNTNGNITGNRAINSTIGYWISPAYNRNYQGVTLSNNDCSTTADNSACFNIWGNQAGGVDSNITAVGNRAVMSNTHTTAMHVACSASTLCQYITITGGVLSANQYDLQLDNGASTPMTNAFGVKISGVLMAGGPLYMFAVTGGSIPFYIDNVTLDLSGLYQSGSFGFIATAGGGHQALFINGLVFRSWPNPGGGGFGWYCRGCNGSLQNVQWVVGNSTTNAIDAGSWGVTAPTASPCYQPSFVQNLIPGELGSAGSKYVLKGWECTGAPWSQVRTLTGN